MPAAERFRLVLAKEDFRFSVAHFTVFSADDAELLHGHNYQVTVEVEGPEVGELGLLADIDRIKSEIRRFCSSLDSRTLLPAACPHLEIERRGGQVHVAYADRRYALPESDVLMLPIANVTMELLARGLWEELAPGLADTGLERLTVSIEEAPGQRAVYVRDLASEASPATAG